MQKNGAGLQTASTCYWDTKTDGMFHFKEKETYVLHILRYVCLLQLLLNYYSYYSYYYH
jgi:hypothetical protein